MEDKINLNIFCDKMATGSARCAARRAVDSLQTGVTTRAGKIQSNRALEKRRQQMRLTALSGAVDNVERVGGARRGCRLNPTTRYHRHSERRVHSGASSAENRPTDLYRTYGGKESADQSSRVESPGYFDRARRLEEHPVSYDGEEEGTVDRSRRNGEERFDLDLGTSRA